MKDKVKALAQIANLTTQKQLQNFQGLASYYRHFIPNSATMASPLLIIFVCGKGTKQMNMGPQAVHASQDLKSALCKVPMLHNPIPSLPFLLHRSTS